MNKKITIKLASESDMQRSVRHVWLIKPFSRVAESKKRYKRLSRSEMMKQMRED